MEKITYCPICSSVKIKKLKDHVFKYPGDDIKDNLDNIHYERLWILFNKIIRQKEQVLFETALCEGCGFIFLNPRFLDEEMKIKYDTINELKGVKYRLEHDKLFKQENRAKSIYKLIHSYITEAQIDSPRILDFGGASGYILEPFAKEYDCNILDFEKWDLPEGIKYLGKQLSDLKKDQKFDVILLLHTLEHIVKPKLIIEEIYKTLSQDGFLYVEVPLGAFQEWKYINDPLTHINFFSEQSLFKLFNLGGLNVIHLSTSYQRVTRAKTWCLNILGTKSKSLTFAPINNVLSTKLQMNKLSYYLPFIFHKRAYKKIFKKLFS